MIIEHWPDLYRQPLREDQQDQLTDSEIEESIWNIEAFHFAGLCDPLTCPFCQQRN
jgi:hypothetical protein